MASPWPYLDQFPPPVVRIMAREGHGNSSRWLSDEEVAIASGLTLDRVRQIQLMPDWSRVVLSDLRAFIAGCRFDPTNPRDRRVKVNIYQLLCLKNNHQPFRYLRKNPRWPEYQRMLIDRNLLRLTG